ncbi:MAG: ferric reductase-like transmembrane domain-containing protein [Sphingomonadaceae bacterium]
MLRTILNSTLAFWTLLAVPAVPMLVGLATSAADPADLLHPSGETSARLMIAAMMLGPLAAVIGPRSWLRWLMARRRYLGVAAFAYALLHLVFYVIDMGTLADMLAELGATGIWTGWAALALMVPLALTSNDAAMRALKAGWKRVQRLAYLAALMLLLHWVFVHNNAAAALIHFAPLALLHLIRRFRPQQKGYAT